MAAVNQSGARPGTGETHPPRGETCQGGWGRSVLAASGVAATVDSVGHAMVDAGGSVHPDPGVAVVMVVSVHELIQRAHAGSGKWEHG